VKTYDSGTSWPTPGWATAAACVLALASAGGAIAQEPPEAVPAGAKRTILELKYTVQDLAGRVEDLRVKETPTEFRIELAADVLFDFDQADVRPAAAAVLAKASGFVGQHAVGPVRVEGHTDAKGTDAYNLRLSERRAVAVRDWLATKGGLKMTPFSTKGFGARQPVAPNTKPDGSDDPDGRQRNRRVEIIIAKRG
jgi:outer membrane protein OmpA-like peptidoglycan-associated protein